MATAAPEDVAAEDPDEVCDAPLLPEPPVDDAMADELDAPEDDCAFEPPLDLIEPGSRLPHCTERHAVTALMELPA